MSDTKQDFTQTETGVSVKTGKRRACAAHCRRFWWLHLIVFCLVVVVAVCLIIFVIVPKVAQSKMDHAKLDIQGVNVLQTEPESYLMEINSTITTDGKIKANIEPFQGSLFLEGVGGDRKPFATMLFPQTNADKFQEVKVSQRVQITDMDAFKQFNTHFFQKDLLRISIEGKTKVQPNGLNRKYGVDFKKTLPVIGLNLFKGTKVTGGKVDILAEHGETNFRGTADIPNASHFTLDLGNVSFTNFVNDENLGILEIQNLLLRPGVNSVDITASLDQLKVMKLIGLSEFCKSGVMPFHLMGKDVIRNGKRLEYFSAALASANQTVDIDIGAILKNSIPGYKLLCHK